MAVSSVSFQHVIDRMNRISSLHVSNHNTVYRSASLGKSAGTEKTTSIGNVADITGARNTQRTGNSSQHISSAQKMGAGFRKIAEKLQHTDWSRDYRLSQKKELQNSVRTFAEEYNKLLAGVKNVSDGEGGTYGSRFTQLLRDNREALSKIGLETGSDGTLSVNSRILKKAKAGDFEAVFGGADSVAGKAAVNSIYAEAQSMLSGVGKLYGYGSAYGAGLGTYGLGALGMYGLGGLGGYGYGAYGYGNSGLNSLYAALSSYAGRYIDTQL